MRRKLRPLRPKFFSRNKSNRRVSEGDTDEFISNQDDFYSRPRNKAIYLLPNAFTTGALFFGFFAIVQAMNQRWETASIAIFCSLILDGMDGRVARMTNTQSAFGEQYDSLADMVSFGVAPALVAYEWVLKGLGKWGWVAAFIYCAGAALRLAAGFLAAALRAGLRLAGFLAAVDLAGAFLEPRPKTDLTGHEAKTPVPNNATPMISST